MIKKIKTWLRHNTDYRITDQYYDSHDGNHYEMKYVRKYFVKVKIPIPRFIGELVKK